MATKKAVVQPKTKKAEKIATSSNKKSSKENNVVNEKYINPKNYLYALLILCGGILLALYIFEWYNVKKEKELSTSYLVKTSTVESSIDDLNSLNQIRQEAPSDYFIFLSYTKDEQVYNLEKDLKTIIDKYKLNDIFYYVDLTELKEKEDNYLEKVKESLDLESLDKLPAIIYVKEGKVIDILDGIKDTSLNSNHFQKLLDDYEFETIK